MSLSGRRFQQWQESQFGPHRESLFWRYGFPAWMLLCGLLAVGLYATFGYSFWKYVVAR